MSPEVQLAKSKWTPEEHEVGLALFVDPQFRARFRTQVAEGSIPDGICHFSSRLDPRFAFRLPHHAHQPQAPQDLLATFRAKGAPSGCYLFPAVEKDNATGRYETLGHGSIIDLTEAVRIVVDDAVFCGMFVSSIPGKLALYRDHESRSERFILVRP